MATHYVLFSDSLGVFLGCDVGQHDCWSKKGSPGPTMLANVFTEMPTEKAFSLVSGGSKIPLDAKLLPIQSANGLFASLNECVAAGIQAWGEKLDDVFAERDRLLQSNGELISVLKNMVAATMAREGDADAKGLTAPSLEVIAAAQDAIKKSEELRGEVAASLNFGRQMLVERESIKRLNSELLHVLCMTMTVLETRDLSNAPGLYDALPWKEIDSLIARANNVGKEFPLQGTKLNDYQRTIADHYGNGDYSYIQTVEEAEQLADDDGLFAFLITEAGDDMEVIEFDEVVERLEGVEKQVNNIISDLINAHSSSLRG